jgi:hypothetical protein
MITANEKETIIIQPDDILIFIIQLDDNIKYHHPEKENVIIQPDTNISVIKMITAVPDHGRSSISESIQMYI